MHMGMSQEACCAEIYREHAGRASQGKHFVRACAIEMHMDMSQEACRAEILKGKKCRTRIPRQPFCARLRSRNAHGQVTRGILCRNLRGKCQTRPVPPRLNTTP